jgi:hypothetical protein
MTILGSIKTFTNNVFDSAFADSVFWGVSKYKHNFKKHLQKLIRAREALIVFKKSVPVNGATTA